MLWLIPDAEYTGVHRHPTDPTVVEFVAYERRDGSWEVYLFAPPGSCPEFEAARVDAEHIFVQRIETASALETVVARVERSLGPKYQAAPFYRELGSRRIIGRILDYLRRNGAFGMHVRAVGDVWELWIRRKDFAIATQVAPSNIPLTHG